MSKQISHRYLFLLAAAALAGSLAFCPVIPVNASSEAELRLETHRAMEIQSNDIPDWPDGPVTGAESAILIEAETGTVL